MLRVIIVDDENMICQLILRLVDWQSHQIEVAGVAHNGEEALSLAQKKNPDIIITDIRIPVFDGLELIDRVQQAGLHARFIVISGYRHFEYAHSALRYGVTDYLLKPINADELNHALDKLATDILRERNEAESRVQLTQQISANDAKMRVQWLRALAEGSLVQNFTAQLLNQEYGFSLRSDPVGLFIIKASCHDMQDYDLMPLLFSRVEPIVQSVLLPYCSTFEMVLIESRLYCLYQFAADMNRPQETSYQLIVDQFSDILNSFESFSLTLCYTNRARSPVELPQTMRMVEHAVHYRLITTQHYLSYYSLSSAARSINPDAMFSQGQQSIFCSYLSSGDKPKISDMLEQIFSSFRNQLIQQYDPEVLFHLTSRILSLTRSTLGTAVESLNITVIQLAIDHASTPLGLIDHFIHAYLDAIEPYCAQLVSKTGAPIQKAIHIIETRYAEPLTLDSVSTECALSSAYLSTLFKKETGSTFSEFLTRCRMNEAKRLLRQTNAPISSIADQTGYLDSKYFSKVFSKTFGISPQKYRSL